ncbi:MAG: tetratricopeptide repeat protein [Bacteroidales bacterium]|nr:tetratricopeptide repeat protein [Bacteroidales bacterium]
MNDNPFTNHNDSTRDLILAFEQALQSDSLQFFDLDELETVMDYYLSVDDLKSLKKAIAYAEHLYPDNTEVELWRAHWLIADDKPHKALELLSSLHQKEPDNTDIEFSLGEANSSLGRHKRAIKHYLAAAVDGYNLAQIYACVADEYYEMKDLANAIKYYLEALASDPLYSSALINYTDACIDANRMDESASYIQQLLADYPYYKDAWHCLGCTYLNLGLKEKAVDALEYAIAIDNAFAPAYIKLMMLYEEEGNIPQAASMMHRLLATTDEPGFAWLQLGKLYLRAENAPTAIDCLRKSLAYLPDNPDVLASLGLAEFLADDLGLASTYAHKALTIEPDYADALFCAAQVSRALYDQKAADGYFNRLIESPLCTEAHCHCYIDYLFENEYYDDVIDFAEQSLELYPGDAFYSAYLAAALFLTNRYRRLSLSLPTADKELLLELCPQMWENPQVQPLLS